MHLVPENMNEAIKYLTPRSEEEIEKKLPKNVVMLKKYLNKKKIPYELEFDTYGDPNFYLKNYCIDYHSVGKDFVIWQKYEKHTDMISSHISLEKVINFIETERINEAIKHLPGRTPEEIASLPEIKEYKTLDDIEELLTPRQRRWVDKIIDGKREIRQLYDERWWKNGGWNGLMDAINDYERKIKITTPDFDNLDGFIDIYELIINEL